jgi:transposase
MVLDRAGWHRSRVLCIAQSLTLLLLPAYSPELNPVELLWWQMRDKHLSNQVFKTADQLDRDVGKAWCAVLASLKPSALYASFLGLNRQSITKVGIRTQKTGPGLR